MCSHVTDFNARKKNFNSLASTAGSFLEIADQSGDHMFSLYFDY